MPLDCAMGHPTASLHTCLGLGRSMPERSLSLALILSHPQPPQMLEGASLLVSRVLFKLEGHIPGNGPICGRPGMTLMLHPFSRVTEGPQDATCLPFQANFRSAANTPCCLPESGPEGLVRSRSPAPRLSLVLRPVRLSHRLSVARHSFTAGHVLSVSPVPGLCWPQDIADSEAPCPPARSHSLRDSRQEEG